MIAVALGVVEVACRSRPSTNHQTGHRTTFTVSKVDAGVATPDETFTTRFIEREP